MFLADFSRNSQHKQYIISFSRLKDCLKNCSSEDIGSQMNRLFLSFEKPFFNLIKHGDIPSPHGDIPVVFYHFIEIESKTTVAKTEGLSKFLPIWSMFKDAPSTKDVGSTLARSIRSDSLFVHNIVLSKLQRSGLSIELTCISIISILFIFLCSQWYSRNILIGTVSLINKIGLRQQSGEEQKWPVTNSFHFHLNRSMEGRRR